MEKNNNVLKKLKILCVSECSNERSRKLPLNFVYTFHFNKTKRSRSVKKMGDILTKERGQKEKENKEWNFPLYQGFSQY